MARLPAKAFHGVDIALVKEWLLHCGRCVPCRTFVIASESRLIFDTRNAMAGRSDGNVVLL